MLNLLLEEYIKFSSLHEAESQVSWDNDVHNIDLLNNNTVWVEFSLQIFFKLCGQFSFDVSYSGNFDLFQEISNSFITLFR